MRGTERPGFGATDACCVAWIEAQEGASETMSVTSQPCGWLGELRLYLDQNDAWTPLRAASWPLGSERKLVVQSLAAGSVVIAMMDAPPALLDPRVHLPARAGVATDGEYDWRWLASRYIELCRTMSNYAARYRIALPPEFVAKAVKCGGVPPEVSRERLPESDAALIGLLRARLGGVVDTRLEP